MCAGCQNVYTASSISVSCLARVLAMAAPNGVTEPCDNLATVVIGHGSADGMVHWPSVLWPLS
jgi:hypothetical protein